MNRIRGMQGFADTPYNRCAYAIEFNGRFAERITSDDILYHMDAVKGNLEYPEDKPESIFFRVQECNRTAGDILGINLDEYSKELSDEALELGTEIMEHMGNSVKGYVERLDMYHETELSKGTDLNSFQSWKNICNMVENYIDFREILRLKRGQRSIFDDIKEDAKYNDDLFSTNISGATDAIIAEALLDYDIVIATVRMFKVWTSDIVRQMNTLISDALNSSDIASEYKLN